MRFQLSRTSVFALFLSLCSLHAFADDSASQGYDLGAALGSLLNGYLNGVKQQANTNSNSSATSESSPQQQYNHTAPMNSEDQAYMAKGLWHDPKTGLTWSLCRVGEMWNGGECTGTPTKFDWPHAILAAQSARLDGRNDWRVPTVSDYANIIGCPTGFDTTDFGREHETNFNDIANDSTKVTISSCFYDANHNNELNHTLPEHFKYDQMNAGFFREWSSSYRLNSSKTEYFPINFVSSDPNFPSYIRLVRNGSSANAFAQSVQLARKVLQLPVLRAQAAQANQDAFNRRTTQLRQNVREGDKTAQGLVIQVKGSLVKLQTYDRVCVGVNQFTNPPICTRYQTVAGSEAWVNRNDLTPVQ